MKLEYPKIETLFVRGDDFKVDPTQIKNPVYNLIREWDFTEKIDGTNIRVDWDNLERKIEVGGRTNNASIPGDLIKWIYESVSIERLVEVFPDVEVTLYGEGYGAGIQKGGLYSKQKKFILFDVLVAQKWWLNRENVADVGAKLGISVVPYVGRMTISNAVDIVRAGFKSVLTADGDTYPEAEGLVGVPPETLFDKNGDRLIVKIKTKDF